MEEKSVLEWLFDDDVDFVDTIPLRPVGPAVFVLEKRTPDMLADGWKWKVAGSCRRPVKQPLYRKSMYYYHGRSGIEKLFQRLVFERLDDEGRILIQYVGTPACPIPAPHGNSASDRAYVRTNPSVLAKIKEVVAASGDQAGAAKLYKEAVRSSKYCDERACPRNIKQVYKEAVRNDSSVDPHVCPRNIKQVSNAVQAVRSYGRFCHDGLTNLGKRMVEADYVHVLQLTRDNFCTVVGLPAMLDDFVQLHRNAKGTVYYDTTFCMGDFYVSCLLYRNTVFLSKPVMPLLMLVYERRTTESHELMFSWFAKLTSVSSVVCVADREQSITSALLKTLPGSTIVYCWNHILGDIRNWIKRNDGVAADEQYYCMCVRKLLMSADSESYDRQLSEYKNNWSPAFVDYFTAHLHDAIQASAAFATRCLDIVEVPYAGITNNVCESFNRVLKDFQNWKERPVDIVVEGFIHLQQYHVNEVVRGLAGKGSYQMRDNYPVCDAIPHSLAFAPPPEDVVRTLQEPSAEYNNTVTEEPVQGHSASDCQSDVAHAQLLAGRVSLQDGVWIVDDNVRCMDKFMVKLSNGSCSCNIPSCIHITAVRLAAGLRLPQSRRGQILSALRRKKVRSGRKQGRKRGLDATELCAPDSKRATTYRRSPAAVPLTPILEQPNACAPDATIEKEQTRQTETNAVQEVSADCVSVAPKRCRRSLFEANEVDDDVKPLQWSPPSAIHAESQNDIQSSSKGFLPDMNTSAVTHAVLQSPGEACAITDVVSGKSPGSLVEQDGRWLTGSEMDDVQGLLRSKWSGDGLRSTTTETWQHMKRPFLQVLFSPVRKHWLTVYGATKCVYVLDSMAGTMSQGTENVVRTISGHETRVLCSKTCTQQTNGDDCGCFALAFATTVVLGDDPCSYELEPTQLRAHLAHMIRQQIITPFPVQQHCYCRGPSAGRMVACDACDQWFHVTCLSRGRRINKGSWWCRNCR